MQLNGGEHVNDSTQHHWVDEMLILRQLSSVSVHLHNSSIEKLQIHISVVLYELCHSDRFQGFIYETIRVAVALRQEVINRIHGVTVFNFVQRLSRKAFLLDFGHVGSL